MALCPAGCTTSLLPNPPEACTPTKRLTTPSRLIFFPCSVDLPDPITNENIAPFFEDGSIVASMPLSEMVFNAPNFEEIRMADCYPSERYVATRELTFQDKYAVTGDAGSPPAETAYFDYYFWNDKQQNKQRLRYMIAYCNGDVKVARDENGNYLTADLVVYLDYIRSASGGQSVEFKSGSVIFQGDPVALSNVPEFNLIDAGIDI